MIGFGLNYFVHTFCLKHINWLLKLVNITIISYKYDMFHKCVEQKRSSLFNLLLRKLEVYFGRACVEA